MNKKEISKYMSQLGKKSWKVRKKKFGPDYFRMIRQQGAKARKKVIHN